MSELFEVLDIKADSVRIITGKRSKGSEYSRIVKSFSEGFKDKAVIKYHGKSARLSGVASTLRKTVAKEKLNVQVDIGQMRDGDKVLILTKVKK